MSNASPKHRSVRTEVKVVVWIECPTSLEEDARQIAKEIINALGRVEIDDDRGIVLKSNGVTVDLGTCQGN